VSHRKRSGRGLAIFRQRELFGQISVLSAERLKIRERHPVRGLDTILRPERVSAAPPAPPPKKKFSEQQVRERQAYLIERAIKDRIAEKTARLRAAFAWQEQLKQYDLDDDERALHFRGFPDELDQDDEDGATKIEQNPKRRIKHMQVEILWGCAKSQRA